MLYFDYSATTFADKDVLKSFNNAATTYVGNPNSSHRLGLINEKRIDQATNLIASILKVNPSDIIYTSGSSEANNLAIKGVCEANSGKHIITTKLEHSSVVAPINRLCANGYEVSFAKLDNNGLVDINYLKSIITDDTVLVSIVGVDSELGIKQNINEIGLLLKEYPNCYFHVDATQMIGKTTFDFDNVDLISFSAHKFFGIKGIGCLIKKDNVKLIPQIDGGKSTTKYRSGTPALELIVSLETALKKAYSDFDNKLKYVKDISKSIKTFLSSYPGIIINNTNNSIDQIINFSTTNTDASKLISLLNDNEVYVSSKSACSSSDALSKAIMCLYNDEQRADNSIRISVSYVTTKSDVAKFKKIFDKCYKKLGDKDENN